MSRHVDAIVIGAGPAGLTAGLYLARARLETLVVDVGSAGGQMIRSHQVANYPGAHDVSGAELSRTMLKQAREHGCEVLTQTRVEELDLAASPKRFVLEDEGEVTASAVILATGGTPRRLGLPSEEAFQGTGISYCATCDGDFFADREIVAIGGGNSALEEAISLTRYASKVTVIHEFEELQAQAWVVDEARRNPKIHFLMNQSVQGFEGGETLEGVVSRDKGTGAVTRTPAAGCFVFIGYIPNTEGIRDMVACNARGEILADAEMATSVPGVFAAGDARAKRTRQITTATADGTVAALSAIEFVAAQRSGHREAGVAAAS